MPRKKRPAKLSNGGKEKDSF